MRIYYLDESEGETHYVRSAIGINAGVWSDVFLLVKEWRKEIYKQYGIPLFEELHASDLLAGRGHIVRHGNQYKGFSKRKGFQVFVSGLQLLETIATSFSNQFEIINVSLEKSKHKHYDRVSLERMLNRINKSAEDSGLYIFLLFDEGKEKRITQTYRKAMVYNPIPSKYGEWETGKKSKSIPPKRVIGGPAFRTSKSDYFIQLVDFVAHSLLKNDEKPTSRVKKYKIHKQFDSVLDVSLNKKASPGDPKGVVRH